MLSAFRTLRSGFLLLNVQFDTLGFGVNGSQKVPFLLAQCNGYGFSLTALIIVTVTTTLPVTF